jgi:hypothetical protein
MATTYANITSATTTTLIAKTTSDKVGSIGRGTRKGNPGSISKVMITNHDDSDTNIIQLHLFDGSSTTYVINETSIPPRATLVLDDNLAYDGTAYNLRIITSSDAELTIIIK